MITAALPSSPVLAAPKRDTLIWEKCRPFGLHKLVVSSVAICPRVISQNFGQVWRRYLVALKRYEYGEAWSALFARSLTVLLPSHLTLTMKAYVSKIFGSIQSQLAFGALSLKNPHAAPLNRSDQETFHASASHRQRKHIANLCLYFRPLKIRNRACHSCQPGTVK